jgi:sugar lactone lactonase YvrE
MRRGSDATIGFMIEIARRLAASAAIVFAAFLCACGGGGGGSGNIPPQPSAILQLFAGAPGGSGNADGAGANASFTGPTGLAVDRQGLIHLVDAQSTVRSITPEGIVTTRAGTAGEPGFVDGTGKAARFNNPVAAAIDAAGILYVSDQFNNAIRRVTPGGVVTTIAGNGTQGFEDGAGRNATFRGPAAIAVDGAGNLFVADNGNCAIRRIDVDANVTTYAGAGGCGDADGFRTQARFSIISGLAIDPSGALIVADRGAIRKITVDGIVTTVAGRQDRSGYFDGPGATARFGAITAIAVDDRGNVYVGDAFNAVLRKVGTDGVVSTLAGQPGSNVTQDGSLASTSFSSFSSIAVAPNGDVLVAEADVVRVVNLATGSRTIAGRASSRGNIDGAAASARFRDLTDAVVDAGGNLYVADSGNHAIRKISRSGDVATLASGFDVITAMTIDAAANLYVVNFTPCGPPDFACRYSLYRVETSGAKTLVCGLPFLPQGIARDAAGNFYLPDRLSALTRMSATCAMTDVPLPTSLVRGIALDDAGNLYMADERDHLILKRTPAGSVDVFAGSPGEAGSRDGVGTEARFSKPVDVAVDSSGNVYVADRGNSLVRKITPAGVVSTIAGTAGQDGFAPGALPGIVQPVAVAVSGTDLYIAMPAAVAVVRNRP